MRKPSRQALIWLAVIAAVLLALPLGWNALVNSAASDGSRSGSARPSAVPPFAIAARQGVAELAGLGGRSAVSWKYRTGLWGGHIKANWWESGLAILTLVRYAERTHSLDPAYQRLLLRTYERNIYKPHATARYQFANEFMDDTAWWGIAWLEASKYELNVRHDRATAARFLATAEWDARYINSQYRPCGGIEWAMRRPADTITSAEFVTLAASLASYRNAAGTFHDPAKAAIWLPEAERALAWLERYRLINVNRGTIYNGLNGSCRRIGGPMTYTQGEVAEALVRMGTALHDSAYYVQAARFLRYGLNPAHGLIAHGVLRERCEAVPGKCEGLHYKLDLPSYKGLFVNAVVDWSKATGSHEFQSFLHRQARAVVNNTIRDSNGLPAACATPETCQFAFRWTGDPPDGPPPVGVTVGGQESAIDALTAVLPEPQRRR